MIMFYILPLLLTLHVQLNLLKPTGFFSYRQV